MWRDTAFVSVGDIRRARKSLKRNKACGEDSVVAEMYQHTSSLDWHWTCAFNARLMNIEGAALVADPCWDEFHVRLLGKTSAPTLFSLLRPLAVLPGSAKLWSRCMLGELEKYDTPDDPSHLGFKKGRSCAQLVSIMRLLLEKRMGWVMSTYVAQTRAYDSVRHWAILNAGLRRGARVAIALAYIREARCAHMMMHYGAWQAHPIKAGFGLRQGCSAAPMLLRWGLQDCTAALQESWRARCFCSELQTARGSMAGYRACHQGGKV